MTQDWNHGQGIQWLPGNNWTFSYVRGNVVGSKHLERVVDQCLINLGCHLETLILGKALNLVLSLSFSIYNYSCMAKFQWSILYMSFPITSALCNLVLSVNISSTDIQRKTMRIKMDNFPVSLFWVKGLENMFYVCENLFFFYNLYTVKLYDT